MSVSFTYRPTNPNKGVSFAGGSSLNTVFENAFGGLPVHLTSKDVPRLEGFIDCGFTDVQELINAIYEHDDVILEAHW